MEKRNVIECNFVFSLWKQPILFLDYGQLQDEYFLTEEGKFYYNIGREMFKGKFIKFDELAISTFLVGKDEIKAKFEDYGGFSTVKEIVTMVEPDNIEGYFDNMIKGKIIKDLITVGIDVDLDKADSMSTDELYEHYDKILNTLFMASPSNFELEDIELTDSDINFLNEGSEMGVQFSEYAPRMNYHCMGLPKGELSMIAGFVNQGKTSFTVSSILYSIAKKGNMVGMIANEQAIIKIKTLLLSMVMFRELRDYSLSRRNLRKGNFNTTQMQSIQKAKVKYNEILANNFKFIKMYDYNPSKLRKAVRLLASLGCEVVLYDVLKIDTGINSASNPAWMELINTSKDLMQLCSKLQIAGLITMQLDQNRNDRRVLTNELITGARGVNEVLAESFMIRILKKDEYTGQAHDCKAYNFKYDDNGKIMKGADKKPIKEYLNLDEDSEYMVAFHTKSRSDGIGTQILYKSILDFATYQEIGYTSIVESQPHQYTKKKASE